MDDKLMVQILQSFPSSLLRKGERIYRRKDIGTIVYAIIAFFIIVKKMIDNNVNIFNLFSADNIKYIFPSIMMLLMFLIILYWPYNIFITFFQKYDGSEKCLNEYRQNIYQVVVKYIWPNATFDIDSGIPNSVYKPSLFNDRYKNYASEALITVDDNFSLSSVHTDNTECDSDNNVILSQFYGLSGVMKLNRSTNLTLSILANQEEMKLKNDVEMDSSEFEKYFDVESNNSVAAMQILTTDVMDKIIEFYQKYNEICEISIDNDTLNFRVFTKKNIFDTSLTDPFNVEKISYTYNMLMYAKEIVEYMNNVIKDANI